VLYDGTNNGVGLTEHTAQVGMQPFNKHRSSHRRVSTWHLLAEMRARPSKLTSSAPSIRYRLTHKPIKS
jgi:hypothetical protein